MPVDWGYSQENGPDTWAKCFPDAAGSHQSPIDIQPVNLKTLSTNQKLSWKYIAENTEDITNPGYCWKVHVHGQGSELTGGPLSDKYVLEQFHCHWGEDNHQGSEHTIDGQKFAGEIHLVHWNATKYHSIEEAAKHPDGLAVLGILLTVGKRHNEMDKIVSQLSKIEFRGQTSKFEAPLNPAHFIPEETSYYTYQGSLTTPPCSECVIWIVFKQPIEVSQEQLDAFRTLKSYCKDDICPCDKFKGYVKSNFRPTLPLGQREVRECRQ